LRPCLFLATLSALPAFRYVSGWSRPPQGIEWWRLLQETGRLLQEIEWEWLLGLAFGLTATWLIIHVLTIRPVTPPGAAGETSPERPHLRRIKLVLKWVLHSVGGSATGETEAAALASSWRRRIFLLLWVTFPVLFGAALAFRNAEDLLTEQAQADGAKNAPAGWDLLSNFCRSGASFLGLYVLLRWIFPWFRNITGRRLRPLFERIGMPGLVFFLTFFGFLHFFQVMHDLELFHLLTPLLGFLAVGVLVGLTLWVVDWFRRAPNQIRLGRRLLGGTLLGQFGWLLFCIPYTYKLFFAPDATYQVSFLICLFVGLIATIYAAFLTVPSTRRLAIILLFLAYLFAANGTSWISQRIWSGG
jgi:hypothetical protein